MGIGEVIAIFWTINDPPGLQRLTNTFLEFCKIISEDLSVILVNIWRLYLVVNALYIDKKCRKPEKQF